MCLGLVSSGATGGADDLLRAGRLAAVGVDAGQPMIDRIGELSGFPDVFFNVDIITVLFIAWVVVVLSFFVLAVQLFVTLIEFKLTALAGFVLVPFAFWNKTAFLARSEEHTSELQSLMRISYAVFCLKKKKK